MWDAEAYGSSPSDSAAAALVSAEKTSSSSAGGAARDAASAESDAASNDVAEDVDLLEPIGLAPLGCIVGHEWLESLVSLRAKLNEMGEDPKQVILSTIRAVIEGGEAAPSVASESFGGGDDDAVAAVMEIDEPSAMRRRTRKRASSDSETASAIVRPPPRVTRELESFGDRDLDAAIVDAHSLTRARIFERLRLVQQTKGSLSLVKRRALVVYDEYMRLRALGHSASVSSTVLAKMMRLPAAKSQLKALMMVQLDGSSPVCEEIGRHVLVYNRRITPLEFIAKIDEIDAEGVRACAEHFLKNRDVAITAIGPIENLQSLEWFNEATRR
jgi:hypothetical protein